MANVQVCWLAGNSRERILALAQIKGQYVNDEIQVYSGDGTYYYLEQMLLTMSCFSEKRLVIIQSLPDIPTAKRTGIINKFKKTLESLPPDILVVFDGIPPEDEKALSNHVAKIGKIKEFSSKLDARDASGWVVGRFQEDGKMISEADAEFLVETAGYDPVIKGYGIDVLNLAVKKVSLYLGRRKNVTRDDLANTVFASQEFDVWRLFQAFDSKDTEKCYQVLEKMILEYATLKEVAFTIFSMSSWRYKMLFFAKEEDAKHTPKKEIEKYMSGLVKLSQTGAGSRIKMEQDLNKDGTPKMAYNAFKVTECVSGNFGLKAVIDTYSRKDLYRIMQVLQEGMSNIHIRNDGQLLLILDALILSVCGKIDDNSLMALKTPFHDGWWK